MVIISKQISITTAKKTMNIIKAFLSSVTVYHITVPKNTRKLTIQHAQQDQITTPISLSLLSADIVPN